MDSLKKIKTVTLDNLGKFIGVDIPKFIIPNLSNLDLTSWTMESGDSFILRSIFRAFKPRRHLEFGTWEGYGACLCLQNCQATVWTINLFEGETLFNGQWAYGVPVDSNIKLPTNTETKVFFKEDGSTIKYIRTDAKGNIGHLYRKYNLGHRVNQIYCDSRKWHLKNYPSNFFDTVLIDGGHTRSILISDTKKALKVLRSGGLVIWHDFCPQTFVRSKNPHVNEVVSAINELSPILESELTKLAWIKPSWLLIGIKK